MEGLTCLHGDERLERSGGESEIRECQSRGKELITERLIPGNNQRA
jgi:hypothetical protein